MKGAMTLITSDPERGQLSSAVAAEQEPAPLAVYAVGDGQRQRLVRVPHMANY